MIPLFNKTIVSVWILNHFNFDLIRVIFSVLIFIWSNQSRISIRRLVEVWWQSLCILLSFFIRRTWSRLLIKLTSSVYILIWWRVKIFLPSIRILRRSFGHWGLRHSFSNCSFSIYFCSWYFYSSFYYLSLACSSQKPFGVGGSLSLSTPFLIRPLSLAPNPVSTFFVYRN